MLLAMLPAASEASQGSTTLAISQGNVKAGDSCCCFCRPFARATINTALYIKENWGTILLLMSAWGIIIAGIGAMHGFKATALPLTLGLGCGFGFGILTGLLTVHVLDPRNDHHRMNTLWDLLNSGFYKLEANGTRPILLSVAIAVVLWAAGIIPTAMGVIVGTIMGGLITARIGYYGMDKPDPEVEELTEDPKKRAELLKQMQANYEDQLRKLNALEQRFNKLATKIPQTPLKAHSRSGTLTSPLPAPHEHK